jgi:hypothetical protein
MARKRREMVTAERICVGDLITAPNGYRATVYRLDTSEHVLEPHVIVSWQHADNVSVPAHTRGSASGRTYRLTDTLIRWVEKPPCLPTA